MCYKRKFIEKVQDKLKELKQKTSEDISENLNLLIREFNSYKGFDENNKLLQSDIDVVNSAFFDKLTRKFYLLTEYLSRFTITISTDLHDLFCFLLFGFL